MVAWKIGQSSTDYSYISEVSKAITAPVAPVKMASELLDKRHCPALDDPWYDAHQMNK
jgi:hypothetical protein